MTERPRLQGLSPSATRGARLRVTSSANPTIKLLKTLHARKGRVESGLFLAEGARLAAEAADLGRWPEILLATQEALARPTVAALADQAEQAGAKVLETTPAILEQVSKRDNAQTVVCAYRQRLAALSELTPAASNLWVALEGVRDPGNLGTIIRTADAVGAGGVILIGRSCDPFSVEAVRATMGSLFATPIARAEFAEFDAWRRGGGLALLGLSLKGEAFPEEGRLERVAILMGNEQSGLPPEFEAACDHLVRLPMRGRADSLNLAVATAVTLYEVWRRQGYGGAQ